ncbi:MAG TPA: hypothetical protein VGW58_09220 [Pyrinomonadaceae bacterium]|nr:hypothetical protein [Pyrinomonadaceae bacterium]
MPSTTITFAGLFVLRPDLRNGEYELGILRARDADHILQIAVSPELGSGPIPQERLEEYIQAGNINWQLEVDPSSRPGIESRRDRPHSRMDATPVNDRDLGWMINLENDEFHNRTLTRASNALQPVIRLKQGALFTSCKTDSVDTTQGQQAPRHFGFITGGISLNIDTSAGQQPVLGFKNSKGVQVDIFRLTQTDRVSYDVTVFNIPPNGHGQPPPVGSHFHLYYDKFFTGVQPNDRFDLKKHENPTIHPPRDHCDETHKQTPNPFRCGGILIEGGDPLG